MRIAESKLNKLKPQKDPENDMPPLRLPELAPPEQKSEAPEQTLATKSCEISPRKPSRTI